MIGKEDNLADTNLGDAGVLDLRGDTAWGRMMAMSLPMMVLVYYGQRYFTEGFTLSGING